MTVTLSKFKTTYIWSSKPWSSSQIHKMQKTITLVEGDFDICYTKINNAFDTEPFILHTRLNPNKKVCKYNWKMEKW